MNMMECDANVLSVVVYYPSAVGRSNLCSDVVRECVERPLVLTGPVKLP